MAVLPILTAPHPVLSTRARDVAADELGDDLDRFLSDMAETMYANDGIGLAAPQVGLSLALAVMQDQWEDDEVDPTDPREHGDVPFRVIVNPHYEPVGTTRVAFYEGCLSVAGYLAVTPRWRSVRLTGTDEKNTVFFLF